MRKFVAVIMFAAALWFSMSPPVAANPGRVDCVSISSVTTLCSHDGVTYVVVCDPDCVGYRP